MTTKGMSAQLRTAQQQIEDYRNHLVKHASFLREDGFDGIHLPNDAWIIIGRRTETLKELDQERLASLRNQRLQVASYDRVADHAEEFCKFITANF